MYEPPPAIKHENGLSCPVCGEQAMTIWQRVYWRALSQKFCRACGARLRRSPRSWLLLLLAVAATGALILLLRMPDSPARILLMFGLIAGFEALLFWRFDRLRPG